MSKEEEHLQPQPEEPDPTSVPPESDMVEPSPAEAISEEAGSESTSEPENDSVESTPAETAPEVDEPEAIYEPPPEADTRLAARTGSSFSPVLGLLVLLMIALGGGSVYIYQEQQKFQKDMLARLEQVEATLNSIHNDSTQTENNGRKVTALESEMAQLKRQVAGTLQSHQGTLGTMDDDILRLKEEVGALKRQTGLPAGEESPAPERSLRRSPEPDTHTPESSVQTESPERTDETQKYIEFVETTTERFFRLLKEGLANIWDYLVSLFQ